MERQVRAYEHAQADRAAQGKTLVVAVPQADGEPASPEAGALKSIRPNIFMPADETECAAGTL